MTGFGFAALWILFATIGSRWMLSLLYRRRGVSILAGDVLLWDLGGLVYGHHGFVFAGLLELCFVVGPAFMRFCSREVFPRK